MQNENGFLMRNNKRNSFLKIIKIYNGSESKNIQKQTRFSK